MSRHATAIARAQPQPAVRTPLRVPARSEPPAPQVAPLLALLARDHGLDAAGASVGVDARPLRRRPTAAAAAQQGQVWLHPRLFDTEGRARPAARALLAHELVHLRQQRAPLAARAGRGAAELEALQIAQRVAEGRRAPRVRLALAASAAAYDVGFDETVRTRYGAEIARIKRLLRGVWGFLWVTDGMVEEILTILQSLEYVSAVSLLSGAPTAADRADAITRDERGKLLDELSDSHRRRFRTPVLALYDALDESTLRDAGAALFAAMDLHHLRREEHAALRRALGCVAEDVRQALRDDEEQGPAVRAILGTEADFDAAGARARERARLDEESRTRSAALAAFRDDPELQRVFGQVRDALRQNPNDRERLLMLDMLEPWMREPPKLEAVGFSLQSDAEGDLFERWLGGFPVQRLYQAPEDGDVAASGEHRLAVLLRLLEVRDPWRNAQLARDLATQSWFLDIVNDEEAWLALQLITVLPQAMQDRLLEDLGAGIYENLSRSQREALGANFYRGGAGRRDLASIQAQLLDDALWSLDQAGRLAGLIRMAISAREHEWVFRESQRRHERDPAAYDDPEFRRLIVDPYQLYDPEVRPEYRPEYLESVSFGAEAFEFFTNIPIVSGIFRGLALLGDAIAAARATRDISLSDGYDFRGVDITRIQGLEHLLRFLEVTFYGVRFADHAELGEAGAAAARDQAGVNFIDRMRYRDGLFEMEAADLRIAAIRTPIGSLVIQGGSGSLSGVTLRVSTGVAAPSMAVTVGAIALDNLLIVQTDAMTAINRLEIDGLDIRVGEDAAGSWLGSALFNATATSLGPESKTSSLTAPDAATPVELRFAAVRLTGITRSGGQYVDTLTLEGATIGVSGDRAGYLRHLQASIDALTARADELAARRGETVDPQESERLDAAIARVGRQREAARTLQGQIVAAQERSAALRARRERGETLTAEQREQLGSDEALLSRFERGGAVVDVERVHITGVRGTLTMDDLELADVHGTGSSSTALLGLMTSSDMLPRILQGERFEADVFADRGGDRRSDVELDLGNLTVRHLSVHESVPTPEEAEHERDAARLRSADHPWDRDARLAAELADARFADAHRYAELAAVGVSHLRAAEVAELRALYERLTSREAFYAHHLEAAGATLTLADNGRRIGLRADRLDAYRAEDGSAGLRMDGYRIGELHGTGVHVDAGIEGGLLGPPQDGASLRQRLQRLGIGGERLEILGFEDIEGNLSFDRAVLESFELRSDREASTTVGEGDDARTLGGRIDADAALVRIEGLRSDLSEESLLAEIARLEEKPAPLRTDGENQRLRAVYDALDLFRAYVQTIGELEARQRDAATPAERTEAETLLAGTLQMFETWRRSLGARTAEVHDLGARVWGLGDVTDFDLDRSMAGGILVEGTGRSADGTRSDRVFASAEVTDMRFGAHAAERISATEAAGRLYVDNEQLRFDNLGLGRVELERVYFEAGGNQLWSDHTTVLTGISATGSLHWEPSALHEGDRYLARVEIDALAIDTLEGNGLNAYLAAQQAQVQVESGTIGGIWASGLSIAMPEDGETEVHGAAGIRTLTDVRVNGMVEGALDFGRARLNGSDLTLTFLGSAGEDIRIGDLDLDEGDFRTADGNVHVSARHVSGLIEHRGTQWTLRDVQVPQLTVQRLNWRSGARTFTVDEPATLSGLRVTASADTAEAGNLALHIDELHADGLTGAHFRYEEPPLVVEVRQQTAWEGATSDAAAFARPAIEVGAIDIADLDWTKRGGTTGGTLDVASVHAALNVLREDLDVGALIDTGAIHVGFRRDGVDVSVDDIGVEASGTLARGLPVGAGSTVHAGISGARTGTMRFYDDRIELPELFVERLDLHQFDFQSSDYHLSLPEAGGQLQADQVSADVTVALDPAAEAMTPTEIVIHALDVPLITAAGLEFTMFAVPIGGATHDVTLRLPAAPPATLTSLHIGAAAAGGRGFVLTPSTDAAGHTSWLADGAIGMGSLDAVGLGLEIGNLLNLTTDAHVESLTLGLLASGEWSLDVTQIDLTQLTLDAAANHVEVTGVPAHLVDAMSGTSPGVSVTGLGRTADGTWSAQSAGVSGLSYVNAERGIALEIASAQMPFGFEAPSGAPVTLTELAIADAWFRIDDLSALVGGDPDAPPTPAEGLRFLDALHGTVSMNISLTNLPDFDVLLNIEHGVVRLSEIEGETAGYDPLVDFDYDEDSRTLVLNLDWGNAGMFVSPVLLGGPWANMELTTWSGFTDEEDELARDGRARLSTLVGRRVQEPAEEDAEPGTFRVDRLYDIDANLIMEPTALPLGAYGTLQLGSGSTPGMEGIHVTGDVGEQASQLQIAVERLNAWVDPGQPLTFGGTLVGIDTLTVERLHDTTLDFRDFKPHALEGRIGAASAIGITVE
jgi:hypothetical protein